MTFQKTYDPTGIHVVFAGHFVEGFADGTFVSIARGAPLFTTRVGVGGDVVRTRSANRSATVTLTLLQNSPSNDALTRIYKRDLLLPNGGGIGSLTIQDIYGSTIFTAQNAWVESPPDATFESEVGTREWTLGVASVDETHGSNPSS